MSAALLQISSGRGPVEVRRFVGRLADRLTAELFPTGRVRVERVGGDDAPLSVTLHLDAIAADSAFRWIGTHQLVAPLRGRGARKRWFAQVTVHETAPDRAVPDVVTTATRAGGPGGQNVNKRATAVRAVDRVSGLQVRATDQRSQARNRAIAVRRLESALDRRAEEAAAADEAERRASHGRLERGRAGFIWELGRDGQLCRVDAGPPGDNRGSRE